VAGLVGALILVYAGAVFALNGPQWDAWRWASLAAAVVLLVVGLRRAAVARAARNVRRTTLAAAAVLGATATVAALAVMRARYSDPYAGSLLWPRLLAVLGLAGFASMVVACAALPRRRAEGPET
jgi:hypothetical protein